MLETQPLVFHTGFLFFSLTKNNINIITKITLEVYSYDNHRLLHKNQNNTAADFLENLSQLWKLEINNFDEKINLIIQIKYEIIASILCNWRFR